MRQITALCICWLGFLSVLLPDAGAETLFHLTTNFASGGLTVRETDGYTFTATTYSNAVLLFIEGRTARGYESYWLSFAVPKGTPLAVGDYPGATRYPFEAADAPGLDFDLNGTGANTSTGQFQILEISFDADGKLATFAANFVHHNDGEKPAYYGQVRYRSALPYITPSGVAETRSNAYRVSSRAGSLSVNVVRRSGYAGPLTVRYQTADGTDRAGRDYVTTSGTLSWADGDVSKRKVTVPIIDTDDPAQADGTFVIVLTGDGAGTQRQATVKIVNDSSSVTFAHFTSDVGDFIGLGQERTFSVANGYTLFPYVNYTGGVSVSWLNYEGSSPEPFQDWELHFAPALGVSFGVGDYQNAVEYFNRTAVHPGLDFSGDGRGGSFETGNFQVRELVLGDDGKVLKFAVDFEQHPGVAPIALYGQVRYHSAVPLPALPQKIAIYASTSNVSGDGVMGPGKFTLTRSGDSSQPLTVDYTVSGSAVSGVHYEALSGHVTFPAGGHSTSIEVRPKSAPPYSKSLTLRLTIQGPAGSYTPVGKGRAKIKIDEF